MDVDYFMEVWRSVIKAGYDHEITWQRSLTDCTSSNVFCGEACWVIINSGMKEQIARKIWERINDAITEGRDISEAFGHKGKVAAIKYVFGNHERLFAEYLQAPDKIEYLKTIPFIGDITCYHLAKNLGHDCVKPDRHIVRVGDYYKTTPNEMCKRLSEATGERVATIDIVIWRACNLGIIDTQKMSGQCPIELPNDKPSVATGDAQR